MAKCHGRKAWDPLTTKATRFRLARFSYTTIPLIWNETSSLPWDFVDLLYLPPPQSRSGASGSRPKVSQTLLKEKRSSSFGLIHSSASRNSFSLVRDGW